MDAAISSSDKVASDEFFDRLLRDTRIMLDYATGESLQVDPVVASQFAKLQRLRIDSERFTANQDTLLTDSVGELMAVHNALAKVVAPATAFSLQETEPGPGPFGFLLRPPLIGAMVSAAIVCAIGFVLTLPPPRPTTASDAPTRQTAATSQAALPVILAQTVPSPTVSLSKQQWNWLFAAGLGAAFFGLFTAHEYVKNRTFDPRYNSVYLIRFVLGVVAGLILGNLSALFDKNDTFMRLGPGLIALLGGFSAEAVNQILQRLVEIMVTVVKGGNDDVAKAREEQLKAKFATQMTATKQAVGQDLTTVLSEVNLPQPLRDQLKAIQTKLAAA
jgi:hypothetical protein